MFGSKRIRFCPPGLKPTTKVETLGPYRGRLRVAWVIAPIDRDRSEEHTSELQSLMRISYAVFCLKKTKTIIRVIYIQNTDTSLVRVSHSCISTPEVVLI